MRHVRLMFEAVRHTRPGQLVQRLVLMGRRQARVHLPVVREPPVVPPLAGNPPHPLFPARQHLVEHNGQDVYLRHLNRRDPLRVPNNWHPAGEGGCARLEEMHLHYMEYLEALDDDMFCRVVDDWIARNPPYGRGYWLGNWNSYALSIRCVVWMQQLALRCARLDGRMIGRTVGSLAEQLRFLEQNLELDIRGNHLIKNIKALLWASRFFAGARADRWMRLGRRLLQTELDEQILPDGMHFERSPAYHAQVFADLLECWQVLPDGCLRHLLSDKLDRMAQALVDLTHPDGMVSLFNDGGLHMAYSPQQCLSVYSHLRGRHVSPRQRIELGSAGYFGLRLGADYLLVDCGAIGPDWLPAHAHGDILSLEWDVSGQRVIVDAGVCEYHPGVWRDYARSTRAHNTVTVADADQCEFWSAFRVGRRAKARLRRLRFDQENMELEGSHDGYRRLPGRPVHLRRVLAGNGYLRVDDRISGTAPLAAASRLLLHPACTIERDADQWVINRCDDEPLRVILDTPAPVSVCQSWWMPDFGHRIKTIQLVMDCGTVPCGCSFTLRAVR